MGSRFVHGALSAIPANEAASVVYAGHFNHHAYAAAVANGDEPYGFMRSLANLAERFLVVDGPFDLHDPTAGALASQGDWSEECRRQFSLDAHVQSIAQEFRLLRTGPSGTGDRLIAVFQRHE
jgi:hypothetical protein